MADEIRLDYCGPEQQPRKVKAHENPLSPKNAMVVIQEAWANGRVHVGTHFKKRCVERGVDMLDVETVIRNGVIRGAGEYTPEYQTCKYRVAATIDDRRLEVVVALDHTEDYAESPLAVLITAIKKELGSKP